jgi:hypothetical protein
LPEKVQWTGLNMWASHVLPFFLHASLRSPADIGGANAQVFSRSSLFYQRTPENSVTAKSWKSQEFLYKSI